MSSRPATSVCESPDARRSGVHCLAMFLIVAACRIGSAHCAEQAPISVPMAPMMMTTTLPPSFTTLDLRPVEERTFSETDFSPRKPGLPLNAKPTARSNTDVPRLGTTTVWQSLNQFRSRDRVRLVTLWESSGSSVSLQAGRHGNPSLQWTSKVMNRGGATRGLLDKIVAAAVAGAGSSFRPNVARAPGMAVATLRSGPNLTTGPGKIP